MLYLLFREDFKDDKSLKTTGPDRELREELEQKSATYY